MKKILALFLTITVSSTAFFLTGCGKSEKQLQKAVKADVEVYAKELKEYMAASEDESQFADKLYDYCVDNGMNVKKAKGKNVVITSEATEGYESEETEVLVTEFKKDMDMDSCDPLAVGLATIKNADAHSTVRLVMSPYSDDGSIGLSKLNKSYLKGDKIINLTYSKETSFYNCVAGSRVYNMTYDTKKTAPKGSLAYDISIADLASTDSGDRSEEHINPIVFIGDIFSDAKADGMNLELASFSSTGSLFDYPNAAAATVVIDESVKAKFEKRLAKAAEKFEEKKNDSDEKAAFAFSVTDMPSKVFSYDDTANILALLYTLTDGVFATTKPDYEGEVLGLSTIYGVTTEKGVQVDILGRYADSDSLVKLDTTLTTIADLSDFDMSYKDKYPLWEQKENVIIKENVLKNAFEEYEVDSDFTCAFTDVPCAEIAKNAVDASIVSVGVNINEGDDGAMSLILYLKNTTENKQ